MGALFQQTGRLTVGRNTRLRLSLQTDADTDTERAGKEYTDQNSTAKKSDTERQIK
jgi:hypothetical protein